MSSGYVSTNLPRRPDKTRPKGSPVSVNLSAFNPAYKFSVNDFEFTNPIASYRSGPSFEREVRKPGAVFSEQNLNEFLAAQSGDFGHQFTMKKVTEYYGKTFCRRPDVSASPRWGQVTNPIPMGLATSSDIGAWSPTWLTGAYGNQDPDYGFAKKDSELITLGTSFIRSTNPIQSQVNLLSSIAEAIADRALLPGLLGKQIVSGAVDPRKRRDLIRATGGEYLNYIFGYKPLADDIAKVGVLLDTVNKLVDQWIKDSGTIVRRRRKVPGKLVTSDERVIRSSGSLVNSVLLAPIPGKVFGYRNPIQASLIGDASSVQSNMFAQGFAVSRVSSEITFSAGYEYDFNRLYTPVAGGSAADLMHNSALRNELKAIAFGLDPASISTALYDATPFSWLLDWFVNVGDVIDNFRGLTSRGVQMLWGYITETAIRDQYFEWNLTWRPSGYVFLRSNGTSTQKVINRVRATPFGFGTTFGSLSTSQSATLAALLAAKSPKSRASDPGETGI